MDAIGFNVNTQSIGAKTQVKDLATSPIKNTPEQSSSNTQKTDCGCKSVTCSHITGYFPNVNVASPEAKFDKAFENATKLSDGSALLMPSMIGSSSTIEANGDGTYTVTTQPSMMGAKPTVKTMTEEELIADKGLCAGLLKQNDDGSYDITYEFKDDEVGWVPATFTDIDKKTVMNLMQAEFMHF